MHINQEKELEIYTYFAQNIVNSLNQDNVTVWDKAYFFIYPQKHGAGAQSYYLKNKVRMTLDFNTDIFWDKVNSLIAFTKENNYAPWNLAIFEFKPDNKFSIDYVWSEQVVEFEYCEWKIDWNLELKKVGKLME